MCISHSILNNIVLIVILKAQVRTTENAFNNFENNGYVTHARIGRQLVLRTVSKTESCVSKSGDLSTKGREVSKETED